MADLFRKSSLERLSNPEQLDRAITISHPMSWLALLGVLIVIVATVVWSILGTLPTTVTVNGIIAGTADSGAFYADNAGVVTKVTKKVGDSVKVGDEIAKVKLNTGKEVSIKATAKGKISAILVDAEENANVYVGAEIARYTPDMDQSQIVVCYVPSSYAQQIKKDMEAKVYIASVDSQTYGHLEATVMEVAPYSANTANLWYVTGANNLVADQFLANGPVVAVSLKLKADSKTTSGYYWSSKKGSELTVQNASIVSAKIVVGEKAPITKLFSKFGD